MIGDLFTRAFEIFKRDLAPWLILGAVLILVGTVIPLFGTLLLLPNALRESSRALRDQNAPQVSALFEFKHLGLDVISMLLYLGAQFIGYMCCCVGGPVAWIAFWYSAELAADARVSAVDTLKVSLMWSKRHLGDTIILALVSSLLNGFAASLTGGLAVFATFPLTLIAWTLYWDGVREEVYRLAAQEGIQVGPPRQLIA